MMEVSSTKTTEMEVETGRYESGCSSDSRMPLLRSDKIKGVDEDEND